MTTQRFVPFRSLRGRRASHLALGLLLVGLAAATACSESDPPTQPGPPGIDPGALQNCQQVGQALDLELASIQSCSSDGECGQVLTGTSCGCTRDLVARQNVSTATFYGIVERGRSMQCAATEFITICDCPAADGFACVAGRCSWNYLQPRDQG